MWAAVDVDFDRLRLHTMSSRPIRLPGFVIACWVLIISGSNSIGLWIVDKNKTKLLSFQAVCSTKSSSIGLC
jgi:hypothetical protein